MRPPLIRLIMRPLLKEKAAASETVLTTNLPVFNAVEERKTLRTILDPTKALPMPLPMARAMPKGTMAMAPLVAASLTLTPLVELMARMPGVPREMQRIFQRVLRLVRIRTAVGKFSRRD
jgi:hypothetical protein